MIKTYFTLGQQHQHVIHTNTGQKVWDKDGIVEVVSNTAVEALIFIRISFGNKWGFQYEEDEIGGSFMEHFPKGIVHSYTLIPNG